MATTSRRLIVQSGLTGAVLITGIVLTATSGSATAASAPAPAPAPTSSAPVAPAPVAPPPVATPTPTPDRATHQAAVLRHPAHEPWSRLLAPTPAGWSVTSPARSIGIAEVAKGFIYPAVVKQDLRFDGYRRGVDRAIRSSHVGSIEQIWQFRRPNGAAAWFIRYLDSNRPSISRSFSGTFSIGHKGAVGYLSRKVDTAGYHFGEAVALEGDIIVHVRVFSVHPVSKNAISRRLQAAARPVAKGISSHLVLPLQGQPRHKKGRSITT